jgi:hypothetical protein
VVAIVGCMDVDISVKRKKTCRMGLDCKRVAIIKFPWRMATRASWDFFSSAAHFYRDQPLWRFEGKQSWMIFYFDGDWTWRAMTLRKRMQHGSIGKGDLFVIFWLWADLRILWIETTAVFLFYMVKE